MNIRVSFRVLIVVVACLCSASFSVVRAAEEAPATSDGAIELEAITVVENRTQKLPPVDEHWLYGRIGEFEVLSNASLDETQDYMRRLYAFHQLFTELFPQMNVAKRRPATFVICGERGAFRTIQPQIASDERKQTVSFYNADQNVALIGLDLEMQGALIEEGADVSRNISGGMLGDEEATIERVAADRDTQIKREYLRFVLSQSDVRAPAWLEEGLAQLLAIVEIEGGTLRFGRLKRELVTQLEAIPGDDSMKRMGAMESVDALALFFNRRGFMALDQFFAVAANSEDARHAVGGTFAMQSLAFLHYSLYGNNGKNQKAFMAYVTRIAKEPATEEVFEACYGRGYKAFLGDLRGYLQGGKYRSVISKNFVLPPVPDLTLRGAVPAEWLRVKADAQRLAGRTADSALTLQAALDHKYVDARLYATVGFLQAQRGNDAEALVAFRNATIAKVDLPGPYIVIARNRLRSTPGSERRAQLSKNDFVAIMRGLMAARERMQAPRRDLYEALAEAWLRAPVAPKNENLQLLEEGVLSFPSDVPLVADTAELKKKIGRTEDAFQLAQLGLRVATDDVSRARFTALANETKPAGSPAAR